MQSSIGQDSWQNLSWIKTYLYIGIGRKNYEVQYRARVHHAGNHGVCGVHHPLHAHRGSKDMLVNLQEQGGSRSRQDLHRHRASPSSSLQVQRWCNLLRRLQLDWKPQQWLASQFSQGRVNIQSKDKEEIPWMFNSPAYVISCWKGFGKFLAGGNLPKPT